MSVKMSEIVTRIKEVSDLFVDCMDIDTDNMVELARAVNYFERELSTFKTLGFRIRAVSDKEFWAYVSNLLKVNQNYAFDADIQAESTRRINDLSSKDIKFTVKNLGESINVDVMAIAHPFDKNNIGMIHVRLSRRFKTFGSDHNGKNFSIPLDESTSDYFEEFKDVIRRKQKLVDEAPIVKTDNYGRIFQCFTFNSAEASNDFMETMDSFFSEDWGLLKIEDDIYYVANMKDKGVPNTDKY